MSAQSDTKGTSMFTDILYILCTPPPQKEREKVGPDES